MGILDIFKSNNKLDKFLNNIPLIKIDNDVPDLSFIKRQSYKLYRQCMNLQNEAIYQSIYGIKDCVWEYSNKDLGDEESIGWTVNNLPDPAGHLLDSWWRRDESILDGNIKYLEHPMYESFIPLNFYTIASNISETTNEHNVAIEVFEIALSIKKTYFQCYMRIGDCLTKLKKYSEAIKYYKTALHYKDNDNNKDNDNKYDAWCYFGLGVCFVKNDNKDSGEVFIRESNKIATEQFTVYKLHGYSDWDSVFKDLEIKNH